MLTPITPMNTPPLLADFCSFVWSTNLNEFVAHLLIKDAGHRPTIKAGLDHKIFKAVSMKKASDSHLGLGCAPPHMFCMVSNILA